MLPISEPSTDQHVRARGSKATGRGAADVADAVEGSAGASAMDPPISSPGSDSALPQTLPRALPQTPSFAHSPFLPESPSPYFPPSPTPHFHPDDEEEFTQTDLYLLRLERIYTTLSKQVSNPSQQRDAERLISQVEDELEARHSQTRLPAEVESSGLFDDEEGEGEGEGREGRESPSPPGVVDVEFPSSPPLPAFNGMEAERSSPSKVSVTNARSILQLLHEVQAQLKERLSDVVEQNEEYLFLLKEKEEELEEAWAEIEELRGEVELLKGRETVVAEEGKVETNAVEWQEKTSLVKDSKGEDESNKEEEVKDKIVKKKSAWEDLWDSLEQFAGMMDYT
ncbi:hypothetical protein K470DRAFT_258919 [Piedraia hortae CBS 480.64]|uniref:Uncharacterized protein n=1 Tax=Piedraia hortae CBS 480.64 TaxID=1314780 RepID=A0A6A7BXJ0_9PEZI|nr:hypothetical protein K470DRAFT_258919 [Piedraia hortae CBS 480.64]